MATFESFSKRSNHLQNTHDWQDGQDLYDACSQVLNTSVDHEAGGRSGIMANEEAGSSIRTYSQGSFELFSPLFVYLLFSDLHWLESQDDLLSSPEEADESSELSDVDDVCPPAPFDELSKLSDVEDWSSDEFSGTE